MSRIVLMAVMAAAAIAAFCSCVGHARAQERRIALVIGNNAYSLARPLTKPVNDARKVASVLTAIGFEVETHVDLPHAAMTATLQRFGTRSRAADWAVVYFSGHGSEVNGTTQIFPIDGGMAAGGNQIINGLLLDRELIGAVQGARRFKAVILDACRADPFSGDKGGDSKAIGSKLAQTGQVSSGGLVRPKSALDNMLVVYAAQAGDVAFEGNGPNSFFTAAFLEHVQTPGIDVTQLVGLVTQRVMQLTGSAQRPGMYGTPIGSTRFFFVAPGLPRIASRPAPTPATVTESLRFTDADRRVLAQRGVATSVCTAPPKVEVDCGPKSTPSEKLICSNYELLRLDAELNRVWDCIPQATRKSLGKAQRTWWQTSREQCVAPGWESDRGALTGSWVCLSAMYLSRIEELRKYW